MTGKITKIDPEKPTSSKGSKTFIRVYFEMRAGDDKSLWAKTDLDPSFRNFKRWKHLLEEGNMLAGLTMRDPRTVDADSIPRLAKEEQLPPPAPKPKGPKSEQIVIKHRQTGLYLQIDEANNNDQYVRERSEAESFRNAEDARAAFTRFQLDPAFYVMTRPKDKK